MPAFKIILLILIWFSILGSLVPYLKQEYWWIRIFDFPRLQLVAIGVLFMLIYFFFWEGILLDYITIITFFIALFFQASKIYPYTPFHKKEVLDCKDGEGQFQVKLAVMNVLMYNRNGERATEILREADPDIILAVETDQWWLDQFSELKGLYPYGVEVPKDNTYGMILYSKMELVDPKVEYLLSEEVPSIHVKIESSKGKWFRFYAVHPKPPAPGHSEKSTDRDAELIIIGKKTRNTNEPIIVAGDLNDVAWSYTTNLFQRFSELLDPRVGRGMFNTFHAKYPFMRWPLDHVFHSDHFQLIEMKRLPYSGSDHFPFFIHLCFIPKEQDLQEEPEADEEDEKMAKDKVMRAKLD